MKGPKGNEPKDRGSLTHRTFIGLFWATSGSGVQAVLKIVVLGFLARLLTEADFGLVAMALTVIAFTDMFANMGVGPALVQRETIQTRYIRVGFWITMGLSVLLTALLWMLAPTIASFFREDALIPILRVISFGLLFDGLKIVPSSLASRDLDFRLLAGTQAVSYMLGYGVVGIVLAYLGYGPWALVIATLGQKGLSALIFLFAKPHAKAPQFDREAAYHLLYFGGGYSISNVLFKGANQGDYLVVGRALGTVALGTYQKAYQLMVLPATLFGDVLDKVLFPAMAKVQSNQKTIGAVYRRGVALTALFTLPASAVLFIFAPEYVLILLGPQWTGAVLPFQILAVGMLMRTSASMSDSLTRAKGAVYSRAWRQGIYAACVFAGAIIGQRWGITGVAVGVLAALSINAALMAQLSLKLTQLSWPVFLQLHLRALPLTALVLLESWGLAALLRMLEVPTLATVLVSGLALAVSIAALIRLFPHLLLGQEGIWIVQLIGQYLPKRLSRQLARSKT